MWVDPIVEEVRKARQEYAARFNNDLEAMFRDLKEQEKKSGRTFISFPPNRLDRASHDANSPLHDHVIGRASDP